MFGESAADAYARAEGRGATAAGAGGPTAAEGCGNPWASGEYSAPVLSREEFERVAVPFSEACKRLKDVLDENGFAIVIGVVQSEEELRAFEEDFKLDLLDLVDAEALREAPAELRKVYKRFLDGGPASFPLASVVGHLTAAAGFVLQRCLAHGRFAWRARRHGNVHAAFRCLFPGESSPLVTSLDVTFFTPEGQPSTSTNKFSAHVDQNRSDVREGLAECSIYQGVLYIWPAGPDGLNSTTVVWPGSHRDVWPAMMGDEQLARYGQAGMHYSEIQEMCDDTLAQRLAEGWSRHARRVCIPPGALLLWNSRTVHTGWRGGPRLAQTVCLEPASRRSPHERLSKLRLAALGLPATHWASVGMQHDMSLGSPGVFNQGVPQPKAPEEGDPSTAVLPLRPALWPAALAEDADMDALASLVNVNYRHVGMWDCPDASVEQLLEKSVRADFQEYL